VRVSLQSVDEDDAEMWGQTGAYAQTRIEKASLNFSVFIGCIRGVSGIDWPGSISVLSEYIGI